jgi:hypothetical protein
VEAWLTFGLVVVAWAALSRFILPRLGIPT